MHIPQSRDHELPPAINHTDRRRSTKRNTNRGNLPTTNQNGERSLGASGGYINDGDVTNQ
ncbi:MAG TPA: hypothetical protein VKT81_15550 [Bryobacteraceae bacterium]|nr:hypothetical protein [Bryobacteraceae bacterium]